MSMARKLLQELPEFRRFFAGLDSGGSPAAFSGLSHVHRAALAAFVRQETGAPIVLICDDEETANRYERDMSALLGGELRIATLPARVFVFYNADTASRQWEHRRLSVLSQLQQGEIDLLLCTVDALQARTLPPAALAAGSRTISATGSYDINELAEFLSAIGYVRAEQVDGAGQFALRGGILDVFSPAHTHPIRIEFFGDEVDSMGLFDSQSQRRIVQMDEVNLLPVREVIPQLGQGGVFGLVEEIDRLIAKARRQEGGETLLATLQEDKEKLENGIVFPSIDRYIGEIYLERASAADYLPFDAFLFFCETARLAERAKNVCWQMDEDVATLLERGLRPHGKTEFYLDFDALLRYCSDHAVGFLDTFGGSSYPLPPKSLHSCLAKQLPAFGLNLEAAVADLSHYRDNGYRTLVLVASERRALNLQALLRENKVRAAVDFSGKTLPKAGEVFITTGGLTAGFEFPEGKIAVLTEGDGEVRKKRNGTKKDVTNRQKLQSFTDLSPGDLVVHEHHGIGRFVSVERMALDGAERDYIKIGYAGSDTLFIPATQLDLVTKYIGGGEDAQIRKLSRLGGTDWEKAKSRTKKAVADLADGLVKLYAERQRLAGYSFSPDTAWQKEFEDNFDYTETDDQLRCIDEIKGDMERPMPMDRLLCGDVGYGKTEVAFRAMMKAVMDGKQAVILVPTTVLARQHYLNALRRFGEFPVNIEVISRFRTAKQVKEILAGVASGKVDILIGTHRLLQKDMVFKDLGLLVVDEEQRFGVTHKERLKEMSRQVDVLTLTATPIPRTLNMALSGIRDMSTIEEPPSDRQPVQTYVLEHDWSVLGDAVRRELARGGQVYYLHNRTETIYKAAAKLRELLGESVVIEVGHGKMSEEELGDVMTRMAESEVDVLVCTTIIETGIDISNVNTLIIEDADKLGLAQLHQIRGRVGRSNRRAFAYMTYRRGKVLTEVATKRLAAIREYAEFGSGFKIAMRDLEIRGAGNVLGPEQSGFLYSVGYEMYLHLLEEAVLERQGKPVPKRTDCAADLTVSANIPDRYVSSAEQRIDLYRRIARVRTEEEADDMVDELIDRYGDPPRPVNNLISVALLRTRAAESGITSIVQKAGVLYFYLEDFNLVQVSKLCSDEIFKGKLVFSAAEPSYLSIKVAKSVDVLKLSKIVVKRFGAAGSERHAG